MALVKGPAQCTSYVFEKLREGDAVTVNGPFGAFFVRESSREIMFIAGGSGIAPVRAMLRDMAERGVNRRATFFFAARTAADLVYRDEIEALGRTLGVPLHARALASRGPAVSGKARRRHACRPGAASASAR